MTDRTCAEPSCGKPVHAKGRCNPHYLQHRRETMPELRARQRQYNLKQAIADPEAAFARKKAWREANAGRVRDLRARWGAENRAEIAAYKFQQRRRALGLTDNVDELVDPAVVYNRDAGICQICGERVSPDETMPSELAPTMDHVIPVVDLRCTHSYANVQLAHWGCNRRKNRTVPDDADSVGDRS